MESASVSRMPLPTSLEGLAALRGTFEGQLIGPRDASYNEARQIWNGLFDKKPAMIARCKSASDVSAAVSLARDSGMPLAVRGGGHNSSGSGSCDGGILIDLSLMNQVVVDPGKKRAWVGGGATWADFDREAQAFGLATPGGLVSTTGVGGLTLSGGVGWLRGKYGLSLDNVASVEMVTADSKVVRASHDENSDLFWAVRGGGGNFGVITMFEFVVHPTGPTVMFLAPIYRAEDAGEVMKAWRAYMATAPDEIGGSLIEFSTIPEDPAYPEETWGAKVMALVSVWAGPADEGERATRHLREFAVPLLDFSGQMPYCEVQRLYDPLFPKGVHRAYFKSLYMNTLTDDAIDEFASRAADRPSDRSLCSIWFMGGAVGRVPKDETAFGDRSSRWMLSVDAIWSDPKDDTKNLAWARTFWSDMQRHGNGRGYLNFAGLAEDGDGLMHNTFGPNYERLVDIKTKYDPTNLFRLNQNIKPRAPGR